MSAQAMAGGVALGVVGGMGALASAEFLRTIYALNPGLPDQALPAVVVYSDPGIPDRTAALLEGRADDVLAPLQARLEAVAALGAERLVLCCMTAHHLLPLMPERLRSRVWSLLDVTVDALRDRALSPPGAGGRLLMVCSNGSRRLRLFESHPEWQQVREQVVFPDPGEQAGVHERIYRLKQHGDGRAFYRALRPLLERHGAEGFVAGCTEIHIVARALARAPVAPAPVVIDPLSIIAERLVEAHCPCPVSI